MKDFKMVLRLMMIEKKDILFTVIFGFAAGITAVGLFAASGYLISKAALTPPFYTLIIITSAVKLLGITKAIARYAERYFSHRATFTILSNLRVSFFNKLEPLVPGIFQKYRSGDLLSRIVGDVETLQNFFLRVFYPPIVLALVFISTILFTAFFSLPVALVLFTGFLLTSLVVPALFAVRQAKIDDHVRAQRGSVSTEAAEFLQGFRDLKIYQKLDEKQEQLIQSSDSYINAQKKENIHKLYSQSVNSFVSFLVSWIVLGLGALLVTEGRLDGILLAMLVMISLTVFDDTAQMAAFPIHYQDSKQAANRLATVVEGNDEMRKITTSEKSTPFDQAPSVVLKNTSFTFPDEPRQTLTDIRLSLPAGSKTAIVGPSGSGKSTLLYLILRMNAIDSGEILIENIPVDQISHEAIWHHTNVILQENHFFYGTIRDNLRLARDNLTDNEMTAALANVDLGSFSLDDPVYEKGENLSGGEKQRLAIARVMLKDANFWLLDEPTSSVDSVTEQVIYNRIFEQAKDDTLLLISHNLKNLEKMDQIIVVENGTIVESGTFNELMAHKGYFYKMKQIEKEIV